MPSAVDFSGADATTNKILKMLQERAGEAMEALAEELAAAAAGKSPTPEEEYYELMGEGYEVPSFTGTGSADHDAEEPGRIRFVKIAGTFLQQLATNPDNVEIGDDYVAIGNVTFLTENSTFQYRDYVPTKRPKPGVDYDGSFQTVGPYFEAFEYGTAAWEVVPRRPGYPLRPDEDPSHRPMEMTKPIEQYRAYDPIALTEIARRYLDDEFAKVSDQ